MLDDYAFLINGLLDIYEASHEMKYLKVAKELMDTMIDLFWDSQNGGFYLTAKDSEQLILRQKAIYDGAQPSGNSLAALGLVRLYHMTFNVHYEDLAEQVLDGFAKDINKRPSAYAQMLMAFDHAFGPSYEIVLSSDEFNSDLVKMQAEIFSRFLPNKVLLYRVESKDYQDLLEMCAFIEHQKPLEGKTTAYVCQNHQCQKPVNTLKNFKETLQRLEKK